MLCYIEELLSDRPQLENLSLVANRRKLSLFPRSLIYTMRERLRRLFVQLMNAMSEEEKGLILAAYKGEKDRIVMEAEGSDFDGVNEKEYRKYEKMNVGLMHAGSQEERAFRCEIKFYLDPEINFYEKDKY